LNVESWKQKERNYVSIRASREGRDGRAVSTRKTGSVSIRASREGRDIAELKQLERGG